MNYEELMQELFQTVGQTVGLDVMLLILEHAQWSASKKFEDAARIHFSRDGISLADLYGGRLEPGKANQISQEFIVGIIETLGRLVGMQLASQLTEQLRRIEEGRARVG